MTLLHYSDAIKRFSTCEIAKLPERTDKEQVQICGTISWIKKLITKKGDPMAFATLEDLSGSVEVIVFPEVYCLVSELLSSGEPLLFSGEIDILDDGCKLFLEKVTLLSDVNKN